MSLLVTGSIAIDTVETPHGSAQDVLGGSAVYFSLAASLQTPVRLVGVVGEDFPERFLDVFTDKPIDLAGLERRSGSRTFRWHGRYLGDMNAAESLRTDLGVLGEAGPLIPEAFRDSKYVFLANTHPGLQREFIDRLSAPKLIVCDTMNLWITEFREELIKTLACVHGVVLNDAEARLLTKRENLIKAGRAILDLGPEFVIIKKGEHGSFLVTPGEVFVLPGYPTAEVHDPTGAGDSFAGGLMGYLAAHDRTDARALRAAVARGTCTASITIEAFSTASIQAASRAELERRLARMRGMLAFE